MDEIRTVNKQVLKDGIKLLNIIKDKILSDMDAPRMKNVCARVSTELKKIVDDDTFFDESYVNSLKEENKKLRDQVFRLRNMVNQRLEEISTKITNL